MQLSKLLYSAAYFLVLSNAAPAEKRDAAKDPVIIKSTTTVHNSVDSTEMIKGDLKTMTNTMMDTDVTTVTRYTATVTSTYFGEPITFTSVAETPIKESTQTDSANEESDEESDTETETETETTAKTETTAETETEKEKAEPKTTAKTSASKTATKVAAITDSSSADKEKTSSSKSKSTKSPETTKSPQTSDITKTSATKTEEKEDKETSTTSSGSKPENTLTVKKTPKTTSTELQATSNNEGPTITNAASIPTSTDSWIIENINTETSGSVCIVNYDYYENDEVETVTSTSTVQVTVTRS